MEELREKGLEFQVICLQETWLKEEDDSSVFEIEGYNLILQTIPVVQRGFNGLFVRKSPNLLVMKVRKDKLFTFQYF